MTRCQGRADRKRSDDRRCQGQDGEGLEVGFANLGGGIPFTKQVEDGIVEVAEACNLERVIADNNFDGETAVDNARNFVTQEVDGVIELQIDAGLDSAVGQSSATCR